MRDKMTRKKKSKRIPRVWGAEIVGKRLGSIAHFINMECVHKTITRIPEYF